MLSIFVGNLVQIPLCGKLNVLKNAVVGVKDGKIVVVEENEPGSSTLDQRCREALSREGIEPEKAELIRLQDSEMMSPGFIDLHLHAPQYSYMGTATDRPLMEWLDHYTFPRESQQDDKKDPKRAGITERQNSALINRLIANGTTTALYFGTLRLDSTLKLAHQLAEAGQRAFVGKVCMDRNSPDFYTASCADNLADSLKFIQAVRAFETGLVQPVITPRFVPSCTLDLLRGLGKLAQEHKVVIQSHISESLDEVAFCKALHPEADGRDTPIFEEAGLLSDRCVMAHGVCLTDEELKVMAKHGAAIAHCPLSNFYFADVLLKAKHCLSLGVKIGLGTDVSGGYSPSMLSAVRNAVVASKALRMQSISKGLSLEEADKDLLNWKEALYLATQGGAQALGIEKETGSLEVGKAFDCLFIDCGKFSLASDRAHAASFPYEVFPDDTNLDRLEKFVNNGDDRNIRQVYVNGKQIL